MRNFKRCFSVLLTLVLMFHVFLAVPSEVDAASSSKPGFSSSSVTAFVCTNHSWGMAVQNLGNGKVISVKSSSPKVVSVTKNSYGFSYTVLKAGTATVTCKVKKSGKSYTLKVKIKAKKEAPFSYIRVAGKNVYKGNEYKSNFLYGKYGSTAKIEWKLKSGWKLVKVSYCSFKKGQSGYTSSKAKTIKNKGKAKLGTGGAWVNFEVKNSKGEIFTYRVIINKK